MKQEKEPKLWVTVVKLLLGAVALIGGVGFALWFAAQGPVHSPALEAAQKQTGNTSKSSGASWGIAGDSPIRPKR